MQDLSFRPLVDDDVEAVQHIRQRAFRPIFESFRAIVGGDIALDAFQRADELQADYVRGLFAPAEDHELFGSVLRDVLVGFIDVRVDGTLGVIGINAVDPSFAGNGIGTRMYRFACDRFRQLGLKAASVSTGGDPSHAPARRAYAKAGFDIGIPGVTLYRAL